LTMAPISRVVFTGDSAGAIPRIVARNTELIRYPYLNRIPSDNGILGNRLSRAVTKTHLPRRRLIRSYVADLS